MSQSRLPNHLVTPCSVTKARWCRWCCGRLQVSTPKEAACALTLERRFPPLPPLTQGRKATATFSWAHLCMQSQTKFYRLHCWPYLSTSEARPILLCCLLESKSPVLEAYQIILEKPFLKDWQEREVCSEGALGKATFHLCSADMLHTTTGSHLLWIFLYLW